MQINLMQNPLILKGNLVFAVWLSGVKDKPAYLKNLKVVISREYSSEWKHGGEPYYPVNDGKNGKLYKQYKDLADMEDKVIFGGRLGEYKYYDMDTTVAAVLKVFKAIS